MTELEPMKAGTDSRTTKERDEALAKLNILMRENHILTAALESAYREGWTDGEQSVGASRPPCSFGLYGADRDWFESDAREVTTNTPTELELMRAGTDAQGDTFPLACLKGVVLRFKPGSVPVTIGFDPTAVPVGKVQALRLDGERIMAMVELNDDGAKALAAGMELASGGRCSVGGVGGRTGPFTIKSFELTGAALTDSKVK